MSQRGFVFLLISFLVLTTFGCKNKEEVLPVSQLDPTLLQNGSVSLYHFKSKENKVTKIIKNHVMQEFDTFLFLQEYSSTNSEEIIRLKLDLKTLFLNTIEIVKPEAQDEKKSSLGKQESQKMIFKGLRYGTNFKVTDFTGNKPKVSTFFPGTFFMDQEMMVYLLSCFSFETKTGDNIKFINLRNQKEGIETIRVVEKMTKTYNKSQISVYKVELTQQGIIAWYMEEKPHMLVEADFPSGEKIMLIDWNNL